MSKKQDSQSLSDVLRSADTDDGTATMVYTPPRHREETQALARTDEAIRDVAALAAATAAENHGTPTAAIVAAEEVSTFIGKAAEFVRKSSDHILEEVQHFHTESRKLALEFENIAKAHTARTLLVSTKVKDMTLSFQDLRNKFLEEISQDLPQDPSQDPK